jgi:hypothetical protein
MGNSQVARQGPTVEDKTVEVKGSPKCFAFKLLVGNTQQASLVIFLRWAGHYSCAFDAEI